MNCTDEDLDRIKSLLGAMFSNLKQSELSEKYIHDKSKTLEEEYWQVMSILKK